VPHSLSEVLFHLLRGSAWAVLGIVAYHLYVHRFRDLGWCEPTELRKGDKFYFSRLVDGCEHETVKCLFSRHQHNPAEPGTIVVGVSSGWTNQYTIPPGQKVRIYRRTP
jgi:hypothetical protein